VHPANITHHFKLLARRGLILIVETRDTGRNLEKYYAPVARGFSVRPRAGGRAGKQALALAIVRDDLSAAIDRLRPGRQKVMALLASARLREEDLSRFAARLERLIADLQRADAPDGRPFRLNVSLYPERPGAGPPDPLRVEVR
jgi:hypothetical protein